MRIPLLKCVLCVVTLQAVTAVALAAVPPIDFYASRDYAMPWPSSVVIADFNADSKADLAVANYFHHSVTISISGVGVHVVTVGRNPFGLAVGDFNGDSRSDLAVANSGSDSIAVLIGNGDGTFQAPRHSFVGGGPLFLAVADLNADHKGDVVVSVYTQISVMLGNGDGTLQARIAIRPPEEDLQRFSIGDVNNDSRLDIVAVGPGNPGNIEVLLGNGNGTFQSPLFTQYEHGDVPWALASGDFNGDGHLDVVIAWQIGILSVLVGDGSGTFSLTEELQRSVLSLAVADFNRDSKLDLVTGGLGGDTGNNIEVLMGTGDGQFRPSVIVVTATSATKSLAAGDLNGDLIPDIVSAHTNGDSSYPGGALSLRLGKGDGTFYETPGLPTGGSITLMTTADFNGDGEMDLAAGFEKPTTGVAAILGNGDGTLRPAPFVMQTPGRVAAFAAADFSGDSNVDLAVATEGTNSVVLLLGNGDGSFEVGQTLPTGDDHGHMAASDFNHDARVDLAIIVDGFPGNQLSVFLGNGDGTFQPPITVPAGTNPYHFDIADFNGDSHMDLAVANISSEDVSVLLGNGDGTFQPPMSAAAGNATGAMTVGNFNGDDKPDLAVSQRSTGFLAILQGNGNGTFQPAIVHRAPTPIDSLVVADFDGDQKQDLGAQSENTLWMFRGSGDGTFALQLTGFSTLSAFTFRPMAIADFTSDDKPDVAVGGDGRFGTRGIAILVNASPPSGSPSD